MNRFKNLIISYFAHLYKFRQNPKNRIFVFLLDYLFIPFIICFRFLISENETLPFKIISFLIVVFCWWFINRYLLQNKDEKLKYYYDLYLKNKELS
jgi:hypothetical protein